MGIGKILLILLCGAWVIGTGWFILSITPTSNCNEEVYILKGVNGMTDENDGLLSGGDVSRTSLLMESGEVFSISERMKFLHIGKPVFVKKCESLIGTEIQKIYQITSE